MPAAGRKTAISAKKRLQTESILSDTPCVCPRCGKAHKVEAFWTGRGMMRKFCPDCNHYRYAVGVENDHITGAHGGYYVGAVVRRLATD